MRFVKFSKLSKTDLSQFVAALSVAYIPFTRRFRLVEEFSPEESEDRLYSLVAEYVRRDNLQALRASPRSLMPLYCRIYCKPQNDNKAN